MKLGSVLMAVMMLLTGCNNLDNEIPADFPSDVPIISGEIYRAAHTNFEDGPGFVVDVLTTLSCEEVSAFYGDIIGPRGNGEVRVETTCDNSATRYVSVAVHLGQEGMQGLNMDQYNQVKGQRGAKGLEIDEFHELDIENLADN